MAITRTPIIDDSGSGTDGTVIDNAWKQELYDQIDGVAGRSTVLTRADTGTVTNWAPGLAGNTLIEWIGTADLTINSIAGGGVVGQIVTIKNVGNGSIVWLPHLAIGPPHDLYNMVTSGSTPLGWQGMASYMWTPAVNRWALIAHEQGAWITPLYSAANFGAGWTVTAGDIRAYKFRLSGRTLSISVELIFTDVAGGGVHLVANIPGYFRVVSDFTTAVGLRADSTTNVTAPTQISLFDRQIRIAYDLSGTVNWVAGNFHVLANLMTFEVY